MDKISKILLHMLEHEGSQVRFVIKSIRDNDMQYAPKDGMRLLIDLANHLVQIPSIDFKFYRGDFDSFEPVQAMERDLRRNNIEDLLMVFDQGIKTIKDSISRLSDDAVLENKLKAFYEQGPEKSWAHYIPEITTHLAMHKMQLWMYLKLAGAPVTMMTYYGVPPSE